MFVFWSMIDQRESQLTGWRRKWTSPILPFRARIKLVPSRKEEEKERPARESKDYLSRVGQRAKVGQAGRVGASGSRLVGLGERWLVLRGRQSMTHPPGSLSKSKVTGLPVESKSPLDATRQAQRAKATLPYSSPIRNQHHHTPQQPAPPPADEDNPLHLSVTTVALSPAAPSLSKTVCLDPRNGNGQTATWRRHVSIPIQNADSPSEQHSNITKPLRSHIHTPY